MTVEFEFAIGEKVFLKYVRMQQKIWNETDGGEA